MTVLLVAGTYLFVSSTDISRNTVEREKITARALAQAKDALIGYAITYADMHAGNVGGYLPCPDLSGTDIGGEGAAAGVCRSKNVSQIGRLPWKTLDLPVLRDGSGECLWYAVSGTYKNNPDSDFMDWDNTGLFQVMSSDGTTILADQAVAVVFSPGFALGSQKRLSVSGTARCGGNYTASNYLDNDTVHNINNALVSSTANAVTKFIQGPVVDASGRTIVDDSMIVVTRQDIFNALKKRRDFSSFVDNSLLNAASTCLSTSLPPPVTINFDNMTETAGSSVGNLVTGRIPLASCADIAVRKWRDNLLYATCSSGTACLKVNSSNCSGMLIFAGERDASQSRKTDAQKNDWSNYLEGHVYDAFANGRKNFSGDTNFDAGSPSADVLACIP
jgi:hypothetical protein